MTTLILHSLEKSYGETVHNALQWQRLNEHVLALCPARWKGLGDNQKWALIRILALREGYVPDWLELDIWKSLKRQLIWVSFDDDTDIMAMDSAHGPIPAPSRWDSKTLHWLRDFYYEEPSEENRKAFWRAYRTEQFRRGHGYDEIMSGRAPQSFREGP